MKSWSMTLASMVLSGCLLSLEGCARPGAADDPAAVGADLIQHLEKFTEMEEKGASTEELDALLFWSDAVITGDGVDGASRSKAQRMETLKAMSGAGVCRHSMPDPTLLSGNLAVQIIEYTCQPGNGQPPLSFRVLYAWQKRGSDWKVVRELWSSGTLR